MKRNLDLIRNMLLLIEANDKPSGMDSSAFTSLNPDSDIIDYHYTFWRIPVILITWRSTQSDIFIRKL